MDIKSLQYFIAVVECTSITKAAKYLHISQPPLSQQLKQLESELGVTLFERGPRSITLTSAGESLYHRAKTIVDFTEETYREISNIGCGSRGQIRLGVISSFNPTLLADVIKDFSEKYPLVHFEVYEQNTYQLLESLENNLIELAFVRTPFEDNNFDRILLEQDSLVAYGHKSFFNDLSSEMVTPEFFNKNPIIIYRRWKSVFNFYFDKLGIKPIYSCINDDAKTSLILALSGKGVAIIPESISEMIENDDMVCVPIDDEELVTQVYAIWNPERYVSPAMKNFIDVLSPHELYG